MVADVIGIMTMTSPAVRVAAGRVGAMETGGVTEMDGPVAATEMAVLEITTATVGLEMVDPGMDGPEAVVRRVLEASPWAAMHCSTTRRRWSAKAKAQRAFVG